MATPTDFLEGFRRRAGLPAPGKDLGGWYSADVFHIFGQIIPACRAALRGQRRSRCRRQSLDALLGKWANASHRTVTSSIRPGRMPPYYIYNKEFVGGTGRLPTSTASAIRRRNRPFEPDSPLATFGASTRTASSGETAPDRMRDRTP